MILEPREFLVYVKGKNSNEFEFKSEVISILPRNASYIVTYSGGRSYTYAASNVRYYPRKYTQDKHIIF